MIGLIEQLYTMAIYFIGGMVIGIIFDFFRILRKLIKFPDFIVYIQDIIFWILTGIILIFLLFVFTNGVFRFYIIINLFFGIIVYFLTFSKFIFKIITVSNNFFKNLTKK